MLDFGAFLILRDPQMFHLPFVHQITAAPPEIVHPFILVVETARVSYAANVNWATLRPLVLISVLRCQIAAH